jgi:chaperone modulatory protein CbpM
MRYALMRPPRLDLESFGRVTGAHPETVRKLVALGLLDAERDAYGALWFRPDQVAEIGRIERLREAFALNYAAVGLVCHLLDRIAALESAARRRPRHPGERSWISAS